MVGMTKCLDFILEARLVRPGEDLQLGRQRSAINDERMVAGHLERVWKSGKDTFTVMLDHGSFAVHDATCAHHVAAIRLSDRLVPQTHAQQWSSRAQPFYDVDTHTRLVRRARSR